MSVKEILDFEERAENGLVSDGDIEQYLSEVGDYLNEKSEEGKSIVLSKMSEERFVRLLREVKRALMTSLLSQDKGAMLAIADISGELNAYTHTIILSVLEILAEEEVI
jgi:hypothetical protein